MRSGSVVVDEPTPVVAEVISSTDETCFENEDGTVTVNATGGTTPYTATWSNGNTAHAILLSAGVTYTVTVTDANGCEATASIVVGQPAPTAASQWCGQ